jgi:hypothetical protein
VSLPAQNQSCAAWTERYKAIIASLLAKHTGRKRVVWQPVVGILKEEGLDLTSSSSGTSDTSSGSSDGSSDGGQVAAVGSMEEASPLSSLAGEASSSGEGSAETVEVKEAGLTFLATPEEGQKTGMRCWVLS